MIYDEIKSWIKHIKRWTGVPGYISYSLSKQTFKDDLLLPHMLFMVLHVERNYTLNRWFERKYKKQLGSLVSKHSAKYLEAYIVLVANGFLYDPVRDIMRKDFMSLGHIYLNHQDEADRLLTMYSLICDNKIYLTWLSYRLFNINRLDHKIEYALGGLEAVTSIVTPVLLTADRLHDLLLGVTDKYTAEKVLLLFLNHRFKISFLIRTFNDKIANSWFASVLQRPVEDVLSEILASQLEMSVSKVSVLIKLLDNENIPELLNILLQQRELHFIEHTDNSTDIVFE